MEPNMDANAAAQHEAEARRYFQQAGGAQGRNFLKRFILTPLNWLVRNPVVAFGTFAGGIIAGLPAGVAVAKSLGFGALGGIGSAIAGSVVCGAAAVGVLAGTGWLLNKAMNAKPATLQPENLLPATGPEFAQRAAGPNGAMSKLAQGLQMSWAERQTAALAAAGMLGLIADAVKVLPPWPGRDAQLRELQSIASTPAMNWGASEMNTLLRASQDIGSRQAKLNVSPVYQSMQAEAAAQPFGKKEWLERYLPFIRKPMPETARILAEVEAADVAAAEKAAEAGGLGFRRQHSSFEAQNFSGQHARDSQAHQRTAAQAQATGTDFLGPISNDESAQALDSCDLGGAAARSRQRAEPAAEQSRNAMPA